MFFTQKSLKIFIFATAFVLILLGSSTAKADSKKLHGGRAAAVAMQVPAKIMEADNTALALVPAPLAGEDARDDYSVAKDDFDSTASGDISDPIEPWNRFWFKANDILWRQYVQPVYLTYEFAVPAPARQGISNFFKNLWFPVRFVNCLLQGKFIEAGVEISRFVTNTTVGLGGFVDVGKNMKPLWCDEPDVTGFGQTLGRWGVGDGIYIIWPFIGPSTVRESIGFVGDAALDPLTYVSFYSRGASFALSGTRGATSIGERLGSYNDLRKISVEPYSSLRNAYVQNSRERIKPHAQVQALP